jgi:hypothetical protein
VFSCCPFSLAGTDCTCSVGVPVQLTDESYVEALAHVVSSRGYCALDVTTPAARGSSCRIDVIGANYVGDKQLSGTREEIFVRAGCAKAEVLLFVNLHRISLHESGPRGA